MAVANEIAWRVLLAFGADANTVTPVYTDVSQDLQSISDGRGSPAELDRNQPGQLTFTLLNTSGAYDNQNGSSPYAGNLVPMTKVKISAVWDGIEHPYFDGYLDNISLVYPTENMAWAVFTATDGFKPLARTTLPTSAYVADVLADVPVALWRLNEPVGSAKAYDSTTTYDMTAAGTPEFGQAGLVSRESGSAMKVAGDFEGVVRSGPFVLTGGPLTLELVYQHTPAGASGFLIGVEHATNVNFGAAYLSNSAGTVGLFVRGPSGIISLSSTGVNVNDGLTHHLVGVWEAGGAGKIYVDGVDRTSGAGSTTAGAFPDPNGLTFIGGGPLGNLNTDGSEGTYQMGAFYNYALAATRIAAHAADVATPWNGDTPAARANRICDIAGWPAALRNFDTGSSTLQSADLEMTALEHLQKIAESEFGELFVSTDGVLTLTGRTARVNRPPLATFGDGPGEIGYRAIKFDGSDWLVRNPVTISRLDGVAQTVKDAARVARYYPSQFTLDGLYHNSDDLSRDAANFFVSEFKDPKRRVVGLTFGPPRDDARFELYPLLLDLELGQVYTVIFRPPGAATFTQNVVVEGLRHSWTIQDGHQVALDLSPAYAGYFLQLDAGPPNPGLDFVRLYF